MFLAGSPRMMLKIGKAIAANDAALLSEAAHTLKGSVGNFAAKGAYDAASKLELLAREGDLTAALAARQSLKSEIGRLRLALTAMAKRYAVKRSSK